MTIECLDCGVDIEIPCDSLVGEIVGCPDCGLDYVVMEDDTGRMLLQELNIKGEDWGE
jgi:alpha-aminoadipate carrier protein LysW